MREHTTTTYDMPKHDKHSLQKKATPTKNIGALQHDSRSHQKKMALTKIKCTLSLKWLEKKREKATAPALRLVQQARLGTLPSDAAWPARSNRYGARPERWLAGRDLYRHRGRRCAEVWQHTVPTSQPVAC